jgi:hypothetical protein
MPGVNDLLGRMHYLLPTIILIQILYTWFFVWQFSKKRSPQTAGAK